MMDKKYNPTAVEQGKYEFWLENKLFSSGDMSKKPFTIVIPPPNVTGKLHLGHTWDNTLQDMIIRRKRMQGYDALYLPGMDHAGIATQAKVDAKLKAMGVNRYELGREEYLKVAWSWKDEYSSFIREQWKTMGLSLDYSKERFTLDEQLSKAVNKVFIDLYNKGYIYRGERIINWDVEAKTALSNIEIEHIETQGALYYITYPFVEGVGGVTVATTRPETMFGDSAIMVHPEDERFLEIHDKEVYIPTTNTKIKIITDKYVDKDFGTGIVKVTPAHDPNDFQVGKRHNLEMPICMHEDGTMNHLAGKYESMERFACRKQLVEDLKSLDLLVKIESIKHNVGHSERTNVIVEPRLSKQWFVKMDELAKNALDKSVANFVPERFSKIFKNWMEGIEDWCISRQLWWGHRIPVWYKDDEIYCGEEAPLEDGFTQDPDVLDTWFSSALWPFSTLGWPDKTVDFNRYYPNDVMVTGYDIIFFWVARMIFQAIEFTGETPFKDVLIHGLIRDKDGKKMSKSLGNGVDPIDVVKQYGADSLRYFITTNSSPGQDLRYEEEKVLSSWNYINKIWNISRYIIMNTEDILGEDIKLNPTEFAFPDKWIITKLNKLIDSVDSFFDNYEFGEAARLIYNFTWNDFASWYIEMSKISDSNTTKSVLVYVLNAILKLLHPYMPFVTEEIYQKLKTKDISIMVSDWPKNNELIYEEALEMEWFFELIKEIRTIRNDYQVSWTKPIDLFIQTNQKNSKFLIENDQFIKKFLNPEKLVISEEIQILEDVVSIILAEAQVYIPLGSLVDKNEEIKKLEEQSITLSNEISRCEKMLNNPNFISKAPQSKVEEEKQKLIKYQENYQEVISRLKELKR
ncbi:MAG: valine--tRNA ligase [Candidatus Izemoplasmatales bacterium]|nr:valine--tRNA ligase [Candidatus Izemoplasmatales bacterium]MDY0139264.1 valine--tRNA ligase [Candidatus Izemoplasmatales bacterium]